LPEYRRIKKGGGTYFFTVVTHGRRPILTYPEIRQALREGINKVRQTRPFSIEAWVLLPDHLHAIWTLPEHDDRYAARWPVIKSCVAKRCGDLSGLGKNISKSRSRRQEGGVWQRRFWEHIIRDEPDFHRHLDYLHWNPVKHGYVKTPMDWPYSTIHRFVAQGHYPSNWGGGGVEEYPMDNFGE
jgi:putative transposase